MSAVCVYLRFPICASCNIRELRSGSTVFGVAGLELVRPYLKRLYDICGTVFYDTVLLYRILYYYEGTSFLGANIAFFV